MTQITLDLTHVPHEALADLGRVLVCSAGQANSGRFGITQARKQFLAQAQAVVLEIERRDGRTDTSELRESIDRLGAIDRTKEQAREARTNAYGDFIPPALPR